MTFYRPKSKRPQTSRSKRSLGPSGLLSTQSTRAISNANCDRSRTELLSLVILKWMNLKLFSNKLFGTWQPGLPGLIPDPIGRLYWFINSVPLHLSTAHRYRDRSTRRKPSRSLDPQQPGCLAEAEAGPERGSGVEDLTWTILDRSVQRTTLHT